MEQGLTRYAKAPARTAAIAVSRVANPVRSTMAPSGEISRSFSASSVPSASGRRTSRSATSNPGLAAASAFAPVGAVRTS